jgi:HPt (histidine-containing phosphotransfer) domain-containing protein
MKKHTSYLDTAIFDFALLKERYAEKPALELIILFLKGLPEAFEKIESTYAANDWSALERLIHAFRGGVCYCCAEQLTEACANLQSSLRENKPELIKSRYAHFMAQILLAENEMMKAIKKHLHALALDGFK